MAASKPTTNRCIVCIGPHTWGRGDTEAEAIRNYRKAGGPVATVALYDSPASFNINEVTGGIMYHRDSPPPKLLKQVTLTTRGIKK